MTSQLINADIPAPNESLLGYLRRLGDLNFYTDTSSFMCSIGVTFGRQLVEEIDGLAAILGVSANSLLEIAPSAKSDGLLQWAFQRRKADPICPLCIAEGRPHHQSWQHALVASCPLHDLLLQTHCDICGQERTFRSGGWKTCTCGTSLTRFKHEPAPAIVRVVSKLISGMEITGDISRLPPSFRGGHTIPDLARFLFFLATSANPSRTGKDGKTPIPKTVTEAVDMLANAEEILLDWPHGFDALVQNRIEISRNEQPSMRARLGRWHERLIEFTAPQYQDFHAHIDHLSKQLILSHDEAPVDHSALPFTFDVNAEEEWITLEAGATALGVARQRLLNLVNQNRVPSRRIEGNSHKSIAVPKRLISEAKEYQSRFSTRKEAIEFLGVSSNQFKLLVESAALKETPRELRPLLQSTLKFQKSDILNLVRMARHTPTAATKSETVEFKELNLRRTTDRKPILALLHEVASGGIPSIAISEDTPLAETRFCKAAIEDFMAGFQSSMSLSSNEVAKMLGAKNECIAAWCHKGLLTAQSVKAGQHYRYSVKYEDLLAFTRTFIPVATLAEGLNTSSRCLLRKFEANGIPVLGGFHVGTTTRGHLVRIIDLAQCAAINQG